MCIFTYLILYKFKCLFVFHSETKDIDIYIYIYMTQFKNKFMDYTCLYLIKKCNYFLLTDQM